MYDAEIKRLSCVDWRGIYLFSDRSYRYYDEFDHISGPFSSIAAAYIDMVDHSTYISTGRDLVSE